MSAVLLCSGRWDEISSWEFFLSDELPDAALCTSASCVGIAESGQLVLSRTHRGWGCPGGHIEDGESIVEAMRREALEEGGFHVERFRLLGYRKVMNSRQIFAKQTGKPYPPVGFVPWFVAVSGSSLVATAGDEGEVFGSRFFDPAEVHNLHLADQPMIDAALNIFRRPNLAWQNV